MRKQKKYSSYTGTATCSWSHSSLMQEPAAAGTDKRGLAPLGEMQVVTSCTHSPNACSRRSLILSELANATQCRGDRPISSFSYPSSETSHASRSKPYAMSTDSASLPSITAGNVTTLQTHFKPEHVCKSCKVVCIANNSMRA